MKTDETRLFEDLAPPPGGPERFRQRLEDAAGRAGMPAFRRAPAALAVSAAVVAIAVVAVLRYEGEGGTPADPDSGAGMADNGDPRAGEVYQAEAFDRLLGRPMQPEQFSVAINDEPVSVTELPSANRRVRIYRIERD